MSRSRPWRTGAMVGSASFVNVVFSKFPVQGYYTPRGESAESLALMKAIDTAFTAWPFMGVRQMRNCLRLNGCPAGRKRARRLMRLMHMMPICQLPRTTEPHPAHRKHPCLLRKREICTASQAWCTDIAYVPMRKGFLFSWPSWTGTAARCFSGGFSPQWTKISERMRLRKH